MKTVVAALDNSLAARPVLATAVALGTVLDANVEPLYVAADGDLAARSAAEGAGLELRVVHGPVLEQLTKAAASEAAVAVVVGARATPIGRRPLGSTALALVTTLPKPVVVVPPDAPAPAGLRRILVPVEAVSTSLTPHAIVALAGEVGLDVIVLHVHDEASIPAFVDQPQHEYEAWAREFLCRYCPWGIGNVRLESRVGRTAELVPLVAAEVRADLIALGWAQELAPGRAPTVRAALERAHVPVMLVPVQLAARRQSDVEALPRR
jgi:nucleotide-binding universal stress UspA family protein